MDDEKHSVIQPTLDTTGLTQPPDNITPKLRPEYPPVEKPDSNAELAKLIAIIQELPERVIEGIRESVVSEVEKQPEKTAQEKIAVEDMPGNHGKKTFAQKWFGV